MKRFYLKLRILLMTFALGLASVFMTNGSLDFNEVSIGLPETKSESPIVVFPIESKNMRYAGGSGGGIVKCKRRQLPNEELKKLDLNFKSDGNGNES